MKKVLLPISIIFVLVLLLSAGPVFAATTDAFVFTMGEEKFSVSQAEIDSWKASQKLELQNVLNPPSQPIKNSVFKYIGKPAAQQETSSQKYNHSLPAIYSYIQSLASSTIDVGMVEPVLKMEGMKVVEFTAPRTGNVVDVYQSSLLALSALEASTTESSLIIHEVKPTQTLSGTNDLGITELVAKGVSSFAGSPKNRRHNIAVGLEKFKGVIIPQGAEFSFNENLGPVEKENGFLPELVIKASGTIPELGGGLCQVSSTTFRAAMEAGLPITQRRNHAYAVQYYSPQGTDATIYPGVVDLKFVNDTPGAILVWPYLKDKDTLIFEFYGTKDGRKVTLEKPVQYDRQSSGAMKATWTRHVVSSAGVEKTDVFKSVYASPALYHKTETFVTAAPVPPGVPPPVLAPPTGGN